MTSPGKFAHLAQSQSLGGRATRLTTKSTSRNAHQKYLGKKSFKAKNIKTSIMYDVQIWMSNFVLFQDKKDMETWQGYALIFTSNITSNSDLQYLHQLHQLHRKLAFCCFYFVVLSNRSRAFLQNTLKHSGFTVTIVFSYYSGGIL